MSTKVDPNVKSNLDRMDQRKMNRVQRVNSLPSRGGSGDWVVRSERHLVNGNPVDLQVAYAWLDGRWVTLGSAIAEGDRSYASGLESPFISALGG